MPATLVDSNVILDVLTEDLRWHRWSAQTLARCADDGALLINPIVYAEVSIRFERIEDLEEAIAPGLFERSPLPWEAAFLAGKCFLEYKRRGGRKAGVLPDFYVGAHASVLGIALLTRDARPYRSYFPRLRLIAPN